MVSGGKDIQPDNNWAKVHNGILEVLASNNFTARELRCLLWLFRETYGERQKEATISINKWVAGTKMKRPHVVNTLQGLVSRNVITKTETGVRSAPVWAFNKYFEQWQPSTPMGTSFTGIPVGTTDSTDVGTTPSTPMGNKGSTPVQCTTTPHIEEKKIREEEGQKARPSSPGYFGMPVPNRKEKRAADGYIQQAATYGVDAPTFVAIVDELIAAARWRSLIDDLGDEAKLNFAKENAVKLIQLGNTAPEHVSLLVTAYKTANQWRGDVAVLPRQLTEYAGQLKDGLPPPAQNGRTAYANGNGRGAPVSKVDKTLANAAALREMLKEGGTL